MADATFSVRGVGASPGDVVGPLALDLAEAASFAAAGRAPVLVVHRLGSDAAPAIGSLAALVVTEAGLTDDVAIIARSLGKPCVVGCSSLRVDAAGRRLVTRDGGVERALAAPTDVRVDGARGVIEAVG